MGTIKAPRAFYCPEARSGIEYPASWVSTSGKKCNYLYRFTELGSGSGKNWPAGPRLGSKKNNSTEQYAGNTPAYKTVPSTAAMVVDHFSYPVAQLQIWPHAN